MRQALTGCVVIALCAIALRAEAQDVVPANRDGERLDSIASLIAGVRPSRPDFAKLADTGEWKDHSRAIQSTWHQVRDGQGARVIAWRKAELPSGCPQGNTLLYPFSGPDFLNANWLFPDCESLVLFGLEQPGEVPDVERMTHAQIVDLLSHVRSFMINLFIRNYFVTGTMRKDFRHREFHGLVPVFMVSMALSGVAVAAVKPIEFAARTGVAPAGPGLKGVVIEFRHRGSQRLRRLTYLSVDVTDASLARHEEFLGYLGGLGKATTLIKSASYLLHSRQFSRIRDFLLASSGFILQDDTGMPYTILAKGGWQVRPYGRYEMPLPPFEWAYQPALAAAFESARPKPLPFRFGYQADSGRDRSNLIVARLLSGGSAVGTGPR